MEGTFYVKAGFDGSSSQSIYKQRYDDTKIEMANWVQMDSRQQMGA